MNMGKYGLHISRDGATPGTSTELFVGRVPDIETAIQKIMQHTKERSFTLFVDIDKKIHGNFRPSRLHFRRPLQPGINKDCPAISFIFRI